MSMKDFRDMVLDDWFAPYGEGSRWIDFITVAILPLTIIVFIIAVILGLV